MTIGEYFGDWSRLVDLNEVKRIINNLPKDICPRKKDIFKAFNLCSLKDLRVVIIGQDPYNNLRNGVPVATGIAFANPKDMVEPFSPSLEILKESVIDYTRPHRIVTFDQSLEKWEEQGVLMLNSALTVPVGGIPGSHMLMWRNFMTTLLKNLSLYTVGIVYVLMGSSAQSLESCINTRFNHVIRCRHPSYYARAKTIMPSDVWKDINTILTGMNGYGIKWYEEV